MRYWTDDEIRKLEDLVGVYDSTTIAKKLGRTPDSVSAKMKRMGLQMRISQNKKGMSPTLFAEIFSLNKKNVQHYVRKGILPRMKLPQFQKIGSKIPSWSLIDDTKIEAWLKSGYVYHRDLRATDVYYAAIVRDVRKTMDIEWISAQDLLECLDITPKVVQAWYYRHDFPRLVFCSTQMGISMYNRNQVIEWCKTHPNQVRPTKLPILRTAGIGKGL